jgi:hypothetical protein
MNISTHGDNMGSALDQLIGDEANIFEWNLIGDGQEYCSQVIASLRCFDL